jgi:hypothetical protein
MIFVLLSWFGHLLIIVSIGCIGCFVFSRLSGAFDWRDFDIFQIFWIGLGFLLALAQTINFFYPLDSSVLKFFIAFASPGFFLLWRFLILNSQQIKKRDDNSLFLFTTKFVVVLLIVLVAASHVAVESSVVRYDTDLYHFNWIRWANEYSAVPGLANLHCRLGVYSGFLLYSALFDNIFWDLKTAWITQGFLISIGVSQLVWIILSKGSIANPTFRLFCLITLPYLLRTLSELKPGLSYDRPTLILQIILFSEFVRNVPLIQSNGFQYFKITRIYLFLVVAMALASLSFVFKPLGALSLLMATAFSFSLCVAFTVNFKGNFRLPLRCSVAVFLLPAVLISGWIIRNGIVSGWLFYPLAIGRLNVEWAVPEHPLIDSDEYEMQSVTGQYNVIKAWAKVEGPDYRRVMIEGFSFWFPKWLSKFKKKYCVLFFIGLTLNIILLLLYLKQALIIFRNTYFFLNFWAGLNIAFWFWSAPNLRFGDAFFWIWMSLPLSIILSSPKTKSTYKKIIIAFILLLCFREVPHLFPNQYPSLLQVGSAVARPTKIIKLGNDGDSYLEVLVPILSNQCGDTHLPCTPYPMERLRLRNPEDLSDGFILSAPNLKPPSQPDR